MANEMKKSVFEFNVVGDRGVNMVPDFVVGVDEEGKVAMKLGNKIFNEDFVGFQGYTIEILDPED